MREIKMNSAISILKHEIEQVFGVQKEEITEFKKLEGTNLVYSFTVKNQKYVIKKLKDTSIADWEQEKAVYIALKQFKITDELVYYDNGIKITKFINTGRPLSYGESDMIAVLDKLRMAHESGASIKYNYDIIEKIDKCILQSNKKEKRLMKVKNYRATIDAIQTMVNKLNIPPVLCHGDACTTTNFLRLADGSIRIIDWEQAGMADPLLDIAIAALHQGFECVDPVWCLHQYLKRIPEKQEYLRLFSFLALDSYALMTWCVYESPEDYDYYLASAKKYSALVLSYYKDIM